MYCIQLYCLSVGASSIWPLNCRSFNKSFSPLPLLPPPPPKRRMRLSCVPSTKVASLGQKSFIFIVCQYFSCLRNRRSCDDVLFSEYSTFLSRIELRCPQQCNRKKAMPAVQMVNFGFDDGRDGRTQLVEGQSLTPASRPIPFWEADFSLKEMSS